MIVGSFISLSGCIKILPEPSEGTETIKLGGAMVDLVTSKKSKHDVMIGEVTGREHLLSSRVIVEKQDNGIHTVDYLARVEWEDVLSKVVQRDFRNTLSSAFKSVALESDNLKTDYLVQCDIESFDVEQKSGRFGNVVLGWYLKIIHLPSRSVVSSTFLSNISSVQGKDKQAVFNAFKKAYQELLENSGAWILKNVDAS